MRMHMDKIQMVSETTSVQYSRVFRNNSELFLRVNQNVAVAESRLGSVSRKSNIGGYLT